LKDVDQQSDEERQREEKPKRVLPELTRASPRKTEVRIGEADGHRQENHCSDRQRRAKVKDPFPFNGHQVIREQLVGESSVVEVKEFCGNKKQRDHAAPDCPTQAQSTQHRSQRVVGN
jgi:hypothetical protein